MAPQAAVFVVDNGSDDSTVELVRATAGVHLIANCDNRGFAAAANQGVTADGAEYTLLLNPDAYLLTGLDALIEATGQWGLAAGQLVDRNGRAQAGFTIRRLPTPSALLFEILGINRLWPSNPVNRRYRYLDRDLDLAGPVEQPAGAFLMVRRDVWEKLGGMDEAFHPVWFEDADFCARAGQAGYRIEYVPGVRACHQGGHSVLGVPASRRAAYWYVSLLRYSEKHFPSRVFRGICAAVVLGSVPRMLVGLIREGSLSPLITYLKIMRFAGACLLSPEKVREGINGIS